MMPALLLPAALAGLAALAIPVLLHLLRRTRETRVDFAALRWLGARQRPRRRVVLRERALIAARLLLVALVVLFLARPALVEPPAAGAWVAVAPGVDPAAARDAVGAAGSDAEWHWLAPGFPPLAEGAPAAGPTASLLRELDARLAADAALAVVVPEVVDGADGARPALRRVVDWHVLPGASGVERTEVAPPRLVARVEDPADPRLRVLGAVATAWDADADAPEAAATTEPPADDDAVLVWLRGDAPGADIAAWVERGGTLLQVSAGDDEAGADAAVAWRDAEGAALAEIGSRGRGRVVRILHPIEPAALPALLEPDFPERLRDLLQPPAAPRLAGAAGLAPVHAPDAGLASLRADAPHSLQPWLALLVGLVLVLERLLASAARRWRPA
uniref:BatA domain-containing protein n=1 Tax=Coralloluteibacterium stylophorae TaxID=1776034 RepID=A0A8J7VUM9_9GAMM